MNDQLKQYANALAELFVEEYTDKSFVYLQEFYNAVAANKEIIKIWGAHEIKMSKRKELIEEVVGSKPSHIVAFVCILIDDGYINNLLEILKIAIKEIKEYKNINDLIIESATVLSKEQVDKISKIMKKKFGDEVKVITKINKENIGGLKIHYKDKVFDYTVHEKIKAMKESIKG